MSCFILPTTPFLKLAFLPRVVIGYPQCYPGTPPAPPPPPPPSLTAPPNHRFLSIATNGAFHAAAAPPNLDAALAPLASRPAAAAAAAAAAASGFHAVTSTLTFRSSNSREVKLIQRHHHRNGHTSPGKGIKRRATDDLCGSPSPSSSLDGSTGGDGGEGRAASGETTPNVTNCEVLQPLYCKVCRVTLNAPAQAKQHYDGKNHSKKMRLYEDTDDTGDKTSDSTQSSDQTSCQSNGTSPVVTEINPEVYCRTCGVSFNSPKQAHQHYQGKNHAKKTRATQLQEKQHTHNEGKYRSKFNCDACNIHVTSQEQLDSHMKGARHAARGRLPETVVPPLRHRWKHHPAIPAAQLRAEKFLHQTLTPAFCQSF